MVLSSKGTRKVIMKELEFKTKSYSPMQQKHGRKVIPSKIKRIPIMAARLGLSSIAIKLNESITIIIYIMPKSGVHK